LEKIRRKVSKHWNPLVLQPSVNPTFHYSMDFDWLIIDGYNLMHQDDALDGRRDDLQTARQRLVRRIEQSAAGMARKITVVFDGREGGRDVALDAPHLEVLFSPSNRTADGLIEQMVHAAENPERILVVTSDWIEQRLVSVFGASVISCREFLLRCETPSTVPKKAKFVRGSTLGDFFPEQ
jgi:predicted RNA-binding protein with PIN domain